MRPLPPANDSRCKLVFFTMTEQRAPAEANLPPPSAPESKGQSESESDFVALAMRVNCKYSPENEREQYKFGLMFGFKNGWEQGREAGLLERETFLAEHDENVRLHTEVEALTLRLSRMTEALEFYADHKKMFDGAYDSDGKSVGFVRGVDPYDKAESDFDIPIGETAHHHGKRAREALESRAAAVRGEK